MCESLEKKLPYLGYPNWKLNAIGLCINLPCPRMTVNRTNNVLNKQKNIF